jgi:hypothetical protein
MNSRHVVREGKGSQLEKLVTGEEVPNEDTTAWFLFTWLAPIRALEAVGAG